MDSDASSAAASQPSVAAAASSAAAASAPPASRRWSGLGGPRRDENDHLFGVGVLCILDDEDDEAAQSQRQYFDGLLRALQLNCIPMAHTLCHDPRAAADSAEAASSSSTTPAGPPSASSVVSSFLGSPNSKDGDSYLSKRLSPLRPEYAVVVMLLPVPHARRPSPLLPAHTSLAAKHSIRLLDLPADGSLLLSKMLRRVVEAIKATPARFAKASAIRQNIPYFLSLPQVGPKVALSCWARPGADRLTHWYEHLHIDLLVTCQSERAEEMKGFVDRVNLERTVGGLGLPKNLPLEVAEKLRVHTRAVPQQADKLRVHPLSCPQPKLPLSWFPIALTGGTVNFLSNAHTTEKVVGLLVELFEGMRSGRSHRVLLHCAAGIHRTGMMLYALLRLSGLAPTQATMALMYIRQVTAQGVGERIDIVERCVFPLAAVRLGIEVRTEEQAVKEMDSWITGGKQPSKSSASSAAAASAPSSAASPAAASSAAVPLDLAAFAASSVDFLIQNQ